MADVIGSFQQGLGLGNALIDTQHRRDRQDRIDKRQEEAWQNGKQDRQRRNERDDILFSQQQEDRTLRNEQSLKSEERQAESHSLSIANTKAQMEFTKYKLGLEKKKNFLNENSVKIQSGWDDWAQTGELSDIFDHESIKGGQFDPRSMTPEKYTAGMTIERMIPDVLSGKVDINDPDFLESYGVMYESNLKGSIGEVDAATGKTIADVQLSRIDSVADINPNLPGNQQGFILAANITYDDGSIAHNKPITENRSTSPDDKPKIIPVQAAMKDMTTQLSMMRETVNSKYYNKLFASSNKNTSSSDLKKRYITQLDKLNADEAKARSTALNPEDDARIQAIYTEQRNRLSSMYTPLISGNQAPEGGAKQFSNSMKTITTAAASAGITITPEIRADVQDAYKKGMTTDQIISQLNKDYGGNGSPDSSSLIAELRDMQGGNSDKSQLIAQARKQADIMRSEGKSLAAIERHLKSTSTPVGIVRKTLSDIQGAEFHDAIKSVHSGESSIAKEINERAQQRQSPGLHQASQPTVSTATNDLEIAARMAQG